MRGSENLANPAIETLNHAIGLRVFGLDQTVLNAFCLTDLMEWSAPLPKRPQMGHDVSSNQTSEQKGDRP